MLRLIAPKGCLRHVNIGRTTRLALLPASSTARRTYAGSASDGAPRDQALRDENLMYVDPNDPNVDTKEFFKFQTGRWLDNDKAERAARETKFSLGGLLTVLKKHVDYLQKTPEQSDLAIATIEPMFEGKHNKLYKVTLKDGRVYTLRIPYAIGHKEYREKRLLSEVATMDFLRKKHDVKLPTPVAWSATFDNEIQSPYILMDYVAGEKLMKYWRPWSEDVQEKSAAIKPVVDFQEKILATAFNKIGSLYFTEDVDPKYRSEVPYDGETDPELRDRWRIGPTTEKRFWKGNTVDVGADLRGPWATHQEYLAASAKIQIAYINDALAREPENIEHRKALKAAERYQAVVPELFYEKEYPDAIYSFRLHHPDLSPLNILVQDEMTKAWLIDFENTAVRPFMLHGVPWFVRNRGERIYKTEEVPGYDGLPEVQKAAVQHYIRLTESEFAYEFLVHNALPELFQALNPNIKRREELVERALATQIDTGFYNDLDFAIHKLGAAWPFLSLNPERKYPVTYEDAELDELAEDINRWNNKVARNTVIESKGFLSSRMFDQYLGEGKLVPTGDGSYKFTKEFLDSIGPKEVE